MEIWQLLFPVVLPARKCGDQHMNQWRTLQFANDLWKGKNPLESYLRQNPMNCLVCIQGSSQAQLIYWYRVATSYNFLKEMRKEPFCGWNKSHDLQCFILPNSYPAWCRISTIHSKVYSITQEVLSVTCSTPLSLFPSLPPRLPLTSFEHGQTCQSWSPNTCHEAMSF